MVATSPGILPAFVFPGNQSLEEVSRSRYMKYLHGLGVGTATQQQLMAIQRGQLHFAAASTGLDQVDAAGDKTAATFTAREHGLGGDSGKIEIKWGPWSSEYPELGQSVLNLSNVHAYKHILPYLPTGRHTWKGIGYPDIGEIVLTLQLIWLMTSIALRLASGYAMSLFELFCLFSLTAFVAERFVTQLNIPAWNEDVLFSITSTDVARTVHNSIMPEVELPETGRRVLLILPGLQFIGWPIFMFVYATKSNTNEGGLETFTNTICFVGGGVYISAFIWAIIGSMVAGSEMWKFLRFIPFTISAGALVISKVLVLSMGILQVVQGSLGIFLVPSSQWTIPHISG
ncbi:hypothetical protein DL98DRAFT_586419 [Cadophora sp. DSE1049]|nr:hypothetical protein DL98DRAFT_586419 [Cadophora sp. DSE1049]